MSDKRPVRPFPDRRARLAGGCTRWVAGVHEWTGVGMAFLPLTALLRTSRQAVATFARRVGRRDQVRLHATFTHALLVEIPLHVIVGGRTAWRNALAHVSRNRATTRETASVATPNALGH